VYSSLACGAHEGILGIRAKETGQHGSAINHAINLSSHQHTGKEITSRAFTPRNVYIA